MDRGASGACADGEMPGTQATTNDDDTLAAEIGERAQINVSGVVDCRAGTAKQRNDPGRIWRRWGFEATTSRSASSDPPDVSILRWSPADPIRMARSGIGSVKPASSMIEVQNRMNAELIGWS